MKKYFTFGLMMSLMSGACFAQHPMIAQLIAEKQAKMEKLEKCQGTTKKLKIAGLSTLGITAVGVGANIAEAVVLNNAKEDVKKAENARDTEQKKKDEREAAEKKRQEEERQRLLEEDKRRQECQSKHKKYDNGACGECEDGYISKDGNCVEKPKPDEKQDDQGDGDKQGNKKADNQGDQDDGDKQGDKKSGDKGNAGQGGKEQNEAKKGGAGEPAPAGEESDTDESEPEEAPQKSDEELFTEACINAGYEMLVGSKCDVCDADYNIAVPESKAYVDNALITAARKMNMGCNGSIYTEQNNDYEENRSNSYIDCLGGRLWCFHATTAIEDDTKKQAEALLKDIKAEKYWENARQQEKQVKVPLKPTPEQVKQSEPKVSLKPDVLKNMERADEIINNKLPCKSDERFDSIMNACVKGTETEEDCPAPKYKYAGKCFSNQTILDTYCKGSEAKQTSMGKLRCSIDLSKERYATEQDGINRAHQWGAHIPLLSDCKAYVHYVGDDTVVCTVGQVEFQFTFDALDAKPEKRETQQVTGLFSAKKDIAKQLCTESKLYAAGSGYYYCDLSEAECQQLNNNDKGLQATYTELGHGYGTHCWVY